MLPAPTTGRFEEPRQLALRGVTYRYGAADKPVLESVDLEVSRGECLVIVGPSGCGKTTLLKIMAGLLPPSEREVLADHAPLTPAGAAGPIPCQAGLRAVGELAVRWLPAGERHLVRHRGGPRARATLYVASGDRR